VADEATKKSVLLVATLSAYLTPFMAASINVALPQIQADFEMDAVSLTWIPTAYLLATAMFIVPLGKLADIVGRRTIFAYGISIFTLASCLAALSINAPMLLGARVVQGIGSAMIFSTSMAMLATVFPPGERGRAIGINVTAVYLGLSTAPFLGGVLTQYISWRSIFAVVVPLGILICYVSLVKLKWKWLRPAHERLDVMGSLLYGLAIMVFMLGLSGVPSPLGFAAIVAGVVLFLFFGLWELRSPSPVLNLELFKTNRAFAFSSAAALINHSATFAVTFLVSLYLQYTKGLNPSVTGLVLMAQPITMAIFSAVAGGLSDRIEPRKVASAGMALTAAGLFIMTLIEKDTSLVLIILNLVLIGFGFAFFSSPNVNAVMTSVEKTFYGLASGVVGVMRLLGQMFSMGITSVLFAVYIGPVSITPELNPVFLKCFQSAFMVFGCLCSIGILASLSRGKIIRDQ
jgi:EmrB/QacA subfamily drug resistance transporter